MNGASEWQFVDGLSWAFPDAARACLAGVSRDLEYSVLRLRVLLKSPGAWWQPGWGEASVPSQPPWVSVPCGLFSEPGQPVVMGPVSCGPPEDSSSAS